MKKPNKQTGATTIDVDLVAACCSPIIRKHRSVTPQQVEHIVRATHPGRWTAAALRRAVQTSFRVIVDLPV